MHDFTCNKTTTDSLGGQNDSVFGQIMSQPFRERIIVIMRCKMFVIR